MTVTQALNRLEALRLDFGAGRARTKLDCLRLLARQRLGTVRGVKRLHEQLCFMRAYPDDRAVLAQVVAMLQGFARRGDLRRYRDLLEDTGIAGTRIRYRFYWTTARRLAAWFPAHLRLDWDAIEEPEKLLAALPLLVTPLEAAWLRARDPSLREALQRLHRGPDGDATFLVKRIEAMPGDEFTRELFGDTLDTPMQIEPGPGTPSRTLAWHAGSRAAFVEEPLRHTRPDLRAELGRPPLSIRAVGAAEGARIIELAVAALVTRSRDIDGVAYGNPRDIWMVDDGRGLQWAFIGIVPQRRQLLRASHGFLTLRNGVPIGYGQMDTLFRCADVSFNSFDTFRGAETAWIFTRLLAATRALLGACAFTLDSYQTGGHNEEAIGSGAWWFYYKLGFRPRDAALCRLAEAELERMRADPAYRSGAPMLRRLSADTMVFESEGVRAANWPRLMDLGELAARKLAGAAGSDRAAAVRDCSRQALRQLGLQGVASLGGNREDVRRAWEAWALLVALLPVSRWSKAQRRALAGVIAAKAGASEREYLMKFDAHPALAGALRALTRA